MDTPPPELHLRVLHALVDSMSIPEIATAVKWRKKSLGGIGAALYWLGNRQFVERIGQHFRRTVAGADFAAVNPIPERSRVCECGNPIIWPAETCQICRTERARAAVGSLVKAAAQDSTDTKKRRCLGCSTMFESRWSGHRLCHVCKPLAEAGIPV